MSRLSHKVLSPTLVALTLIAGTTACKSGSSQRSPDAPPAPSPTASGQTKGPLPQPTLEGGPGANGGNVLPLYVGTSSENVLCGTAQNVVCTTVTICQPGTTTCQAIDNVLVDTGSSGLRVFSSLIKFSTSKVPANSGTLAECVGYADNSSQWGPIVTVDIQLGKETASSVPVQLIDSTYATPPAACTAGQSTPDQSPTSSSFNGILGVSMQKQDCGAGCDSNDNNGEYYSCNGLTCTPAATATQVGNPVARLPNDNNGIVITFPEVATTGAVNVSGSLILGIGTQANNIPPASVIALPADPDLYIATIFPDFGTKPLQSFIDSGSSTYAIPKVAALPLCGGSSLAAAFCPASTLTLTATNTGSGGTPSAPVNFQIANAISLTSRNYAVFMDLGEDPAASGATSIQSKFDFGLPFFFGRTLYFGFENSASTLGEGPLYAY